MEVVTNTMYTLLAVESVLHIDLCAVVKKWHCTLTVHFIEAVKAQFCRYIGLAEHMKYMSDEKKALKAIKHFSTII